MRLMIAFNDGWVFNDGFDASSDTARAPASRHLPHTAVELPFSYFDETRYQRAFTYQKTLRAPIRRGTASEVSLVFDGAMADAVVYLNGERDRRSQGWLHAVSRRG